MNALSRTLTDLSGALSRLTLTPAMNELRLADLLEFAREPGRYPHMELALDALHVRYSMAETIPDFRAKIERRRRQELMKQDTGHWSFCANRLVCWSAVIKTIDEFERMG
jgi:hypothetical protein